MSVKPDHSEDEEGNHGLEVPLVETNRFGFILGNGETDSDGPCPELVRHRESKWLSLMTQWEQVMEKKSHKVKSQCQKGIPASVRAKCWPLLCGAKDRKKKTENSELYKNLVKAPDHQGWTDIIKRDTDRQFPFHEMFQSKDGHGQKDLLDVLKAYTQYRPDEGYCQAQGPVAAVLLMNMPAEEAFWCLVQISELFLPGYYSPLLEGVLFDAAVLSSILKKLCPAAHKHLQNQGVEPLMFATDWLMCLYSRHLPFNTLLRVWDLFFCYGVRVLFQVAVVLVRRCLGEGRQRKECDGQMETLERLRGVKQRVQNEQADAFIHEVCSVSLSLADLQKQTEKELEKWKKDRPNSTFDPRGRCHGHRTVWERAQEKQKERPKGSLSIPIMRSHSSLSPSLLRKKWRKRSSKTDTEEWDGGGRKFSQSLVEESDDEEIKRRRSLCTIAGEQRAKQDRLSDELCTFKHKDHNKHPNISLTVFSSIDSDVFEKEHSETTHLDEKGITHGCVVEESIQTHQHTTEEDKNQDDLNTEAPTNQNEQNTDKQICQDESTPVEKEDTQTDSNKQEEEIQFDSNIQEAEIQTKRNKQDRLPQIIVHEDNLQNISETDVKMHVVQEEQMCQTSGDQQEGLDVNIHTATGDKETLLVGEKHTDVNNEERIQQEVNVLPEMTHMCEEKDDKGSEEDRQGVSLEQKDNHLFSGGKEEMQASDSVLTSSLLQDSETEHPDRSADLIQQSQSRDPENNDMDIIMIAEELAVDSTVGDSSGSGNPDQSDVDSAVDTNILESQEVTVESRLSDNTSNDTVCCEVKLCNLTHSVKIHTCESAHLLSNKMPVTRESVHSETNVLDSDVGSMEDNEVKTRSGNLENNISDVSTGSEKPESSDMTTAVEPGKIVDSTFENPEINQVIITTNPEHTDVNVKTDIVDLVVGSEITRELIIAGTHPVCHDEPHNPDSNKVDSIHVPITNAFDSPECNDDPISCISGEPVSNIEDLAEGTGNQDNNEVHVTTDPEKTESNETEIAAGSVNSDVSNDEKSECNTVLVTPESGNPESNTQVGYQDNKEVHVTTGPEKTESNETEIAAGSVNSDGSNDEKSECNTVLVTPESGNPESNDTQVGYQDNKEVHVTTGPEKTESNEMEIAAGAVHSDGSTVEKSESNESGNPDSKKVDLSIESGNPDNEKLHVVSKSNHPDTNKEHVTAASGNPTKDSAAGSDNTECAIPANIQVCESPFPIQPSKSPHPNIPPNHLRVRRTSSSRVCYPTILSEDTFREPQQQEHTNTEMTTHTLTEDTNVQPSSPTKSGAQKRLGLFRRLRGENNKTAIPKILIQDFSEKDERLTSKERRRRKREKERKEREEKDRKKREKELEKEKEKERKKPQTRGKSFQVLSKKGVDNAVLPENSDSQTPRPRRNSAPFSDSYF